MEQKEVRGSSTLYWYSLKSLLEERFPLANAISPTAFLSPVRCNNMQYAMYTYAVCNLSEDSTLDYCFFYYYVTTSWLLLYYCFYYSFTIAVCNLSEDSTLDCCFFFTTTSLLLDYRFTTCSLLLLLLLNYCFTTCLLLLLLLLDYCFTTCSQLLLLLLNYCFTTCLLLVYYWFY